MSVDKLMKKNTFIAENGFVFWESFHGVADPSLPEFSVNGVRVHLKSKSTASLQKKHLKIERFNIITSSWENDSNISNNNQKNLIVNPINPIYSQ